MYDLRHSKKPTVFVRLRYLDKPSVCLPLVYKTKSGKLDHVMQEYYVYFLLSTVQHVEEKPHSVALTVNDKSCSNLSPDIAVQSLVLEPDAVDYAVCLHKALFHLSDAQVSEDHEIYSHCTSAPVYSHCTSAPVVIVPLHL